MPPISNPNNGQNKNQAKRENNGQKNNGQKNNGQKNNGPRNNGTSKKTKMSMRANVKPGIMNRTVEGFSFLGMYNNIVAFVIGLILFSIGGYIRSYDDIPYTEVKGKVSSVTWEDDDGCKSEEVTSEKGKKEIHWKCNVTVKYKDGKTENEQEYKFSNIGKKRYFKNQSITLYRITADGTITNEDPNAWKMIGWILLAFGFLFMFASLFWLWICTQPWGKELCAAQAATQMIGGAFRSRD